jgi:glycine/D-amino acid oxidase-like deaminating enzyme
MIGLVPSGVVLNGKRGEGRRSERNPCRGWHLDHDHGDCGSDWILARSGLYSDRVAALTGRLFPHRGQYFLIWTESRLLAGNLIYPFLIRGFGFWVCAAFLVRTTRKGRFWPYLGDRNHGAAVFDYTPTRERAGPERFLQGYRGYLQAEAYVA